MPATTDYEIPHVRQPAARVLGWCLEAVQEGEGWLKAQRPAVDWDRALQVLSDSGSDASIDGLSNLGYNKTKRVARELVASLANFRHEGEFKVTWNNQLHDVANTLTNLDRNWYRQTYANDAHRAALQYAVATGTSYLYETWDKHFYSPYRGDIRLQALSPADVTFVQLPKTHNIQQAYAVIIREELPINLAKSIYADLDKGRFSASLVPDRDSPGWLQKGLQKMQQFIAPALRVAGRSPNQAAQASFPTVDIFHMYVMDRSINDTGAPMPMGSPGLNWSYTVPSLGDPLPTSMVNPATGNFFTVPATDEQCRLFPLRRYLIFSRTASGYDGSSPWWHGAVPLARIRFTDWAWEALGQSQISELKTIQDGIVALMRGMEDSAAARLDPPMLYDDQLGSTWAQAVNPRKAGGRAAAPLSQIAEPVKPILPPQYYDVPPWIPEWISAQEDRMDYLAATRDLVAIAKAKQVPGADTLEKLMEMAGPIVQDLVRQIEHPLQQLGEWRKALYFQFYTSARMLTVTGPEGVDIDVQYTPEQLLAIHPAETPESFATRKRRSLDEFHYAVTESGINEIHRMTNKLFYIQLMKVGFPISWWTFAKIAQIPNFGPPPEGTNTEMERWIAQKRIEVDIAIAQQVQAAETMQAAGLAGPGGMGGDPAAGGGDPAAGGAPPPGGGAPGGGGGGRPPSFSKSPRLESKDGGTRSTIATS